MSPISSAHKNKKTVKVRRYLSYLLYFSGVAVLGYAGFQYGAMVFEQRHLQALWRQQQESCRLSSRKSVAASYSGLTRIEIPSIRLSAVMVEGTDGSSLMIAPGHMIGTAEPGDPGNAVISAHRDTFFRNILDLRPGDPIVIERDSRSFTYTVEGFRFVKPSDISVVAPAGDNRLTLVTCDPAYYLGDAPQRLVVISKLATPASNPLDDAALKQPQSPIQARLVSTDGAIRK